MLVLRAIERRVAQWQSAATTWQRPEVRFLPPPTITDPTIFGATFYLGTRANLGVRRKAAPDLRSQANSPRRSASTIQLQRAARESHCQLNSVASFSPLRSHFISFLSWLIFARNHHRVAKEISHKPRVFGRPGEGIYSKLMIVFLNFGNGRAVSKIWHRTRRCHPQTRACAFLYGNSIEG